MLKNALKIINLQASDIVYVVPKTYLTIESFICTTHINISLGIEFLKH